MREVNRDCYGQDLKQTPAKPIVVDLDGTLLKSDMLWESLFLYLKLIPWCFYKPLLWLIMGGKSNLKTRLAQEININIENLPFDTSLINWLKTEKTADRTLIIATASQEIYAHKISEFLGMFDRVFASNHQINLAGKNKRDMLVKEFGLRGFDYVGNSKDDLYVWASADRAILVNPSSRVEKHALRQGNVHEIMKSNHSSLKAWIKALRLQQWIKNLLLFVPLLAAHRVTSLSMICIGILAFVFFGLCASSVYLFNDLVDLEDDRQHITKKHRQFAAGNISISSGVLVIFILLVLAFVGALLLLPFKFLITLLIYYVITISYSFFLKRIMMLDVIILAILYTLRIIAGTFTFDMQLTFWMLGFSLFIFTSLALIKRYAELKQLTSDNQWQKIHGRGYYASDLEMIGSLGAASGYLSVLVLALYIQDSATTSLYRYPEIIWFACPLLLFWINRTWLLTHRGLMQDDPVIYAVKDYISLITGVLFLMIFWWAT